MKMLAKRVIPTALSGIAVALSGFAMKAAAAPPDSQPSVTGHVEFINATTGNDIRYSINAIQHADGSVTGEFEEHVVSATGDFVRRTHGVVTCVTVAGNVARIGGFITQSSGANVAPPGSEVFTTVVDNGEGENAPDLDDLASPGGSGRPGSGVAERHCRTGLPRPLFRVIAGNIQVRPTGL